MSNPVAMPPPRTHADRESPAFTVRPATAHDAPALAALWSEVFGRPLTAARWRWKLHSQPAPAPTSWLAEAEGRVVGHYAGTPMRYRLDGAERCVLHGCDALTAPSFRRRGVLTAVHGRANEAWAAAGIPFQTGLHYNGWGSRREFLGWVPLFRLVWLRLALRPFRRAHLAPADAFWRCALDGWMARGAAPVTVSEVTSAGSAFDDLWQRASLGYDLLAVRDRAWVGWRFLAAPDDDYQVRLAEAAGEPVGYVATRLTATPRPVGWLADLFAAPGDVAVRRALLRRAAADLHAAGAESLVALVAAGAPLHSELRRAGFLPARGHFDFSVVPFDPAFPPERLADPSRWLLMGADFDVM